MVWTMAFLADVVVPRTVDGAARTTTARAVAVDLALLLLFAVQHSVMARHQVKSWLRRRTPPALERTTYILATDICLALLLVLWQPLGGQIWHVDGPAAMVLWSLCAAGWVLAIVSTFAVDHLELMGLRQAGWVAARDTDTTTGLRVDGLYAVVRHPLMTGLVLAFWATPQMGASHLLFALAATGYIAVGIRFEERDLRKRVRRLVRRLCRPRPLPRAQAAVQTPCPRRYRPSTGLTSPCWSAYRLAPTRLVAPILA